MGVLSFRNLLAPRAWPGVSDNVRELFLRRDSTECRAWASYNRSGCDTDVNVYVGGERSFSVSTSSTWGHEINNILINVCRITI